MYRVWAIDLIYIYIYIYINKILGIDDHCISPKKTRGVCDLSLPLIYKILQKPQSSHRAVLDCETNKQKKKKKHSQSLRNMLRRIDTQHSQRSCERKDTDGNNLL